MRWTAGLVAFLAFGAQETPEFRSPPLRVPDGFVVEVAAAPPLVRHPMMACFDDRGRLYIAESDGQNLKKDELLKQPGRFIRRLEDTDGDGKFDRSVIFADAMVMPEGALWHDGALYVVSAPYLWKLRDTDGDGRADVREQVLGEMEFDGRANQHGPYLGPEGRLYFSGGHFGYDFVGKDGKRPGAGTAAGVFSCRADGTDPEIVGHGSINPVEVVFTPEGEMLSTCAIFDGVGGRHDALVHWIRGGQYGPSPYGRGVLKETGQRLPAVMRWGQVAPAGLMRYRGAHFGEEYRENLFACHFNTHKVVRVRLERRGSTFASRDEDFLTSTSIDFHPADILEDADGSLLLIDTGGWLSWGCPTSSIAKPNILGAIYRIRKAGGPVVSDPRGLKVETPLLDDPRPAVQDRAIAALVAEKTLPSLGGSPLARRNAVETLSRIGTPAARAALRGALADPDPTVRQLAVHSAGRLRDAESVAVLAKCVTDDTAPIRRAAASALGEIGKGEAVPALLASLARDADGHLLHALIYALIEIGDARGTAAGLSHPDPSVRRAALIALDKMAGGGLTLDQVTPQLDSSSAPLRQAAMGIIASRPAWARELASRIPEWLRGEVEESRRADVQGVLVAFWADPAVQDHMALALRQEGTPAGTRLLVLEGMGRAPLEKPVTLWAAEVRWSLKHPDLRVARQAVAVLRAWGFGEFDAALLDLARDPARPEELRTEALAAAMPRVARLEGALFAFLVGCLNGEKPVLLRLTAAQALGAARLSDAQLTQLVPAVAAAGALEMPKLLPAFERSKSAEVGKKLVAALEKAPGVESLSAEALRRTLKEYPEEVRGASRALLKRLEGDVEQQKAKLAELEPAMAGGVEARGREVFFGKKAACSACHAVGGEGGKVGPDLSKIGGIRTARDLLEAIVFPSATIVNGYEPYLVRTRDGGITEGLLVRETAEAIFLYQTDRTERRVPKSAVETIRQSRMSIMPQGLDAQLTRAELADLIAFLRSQK